MARLEDLSSKKLKTVVDIFMVRCFHLAYRTLANECNGKTERFVVAIAATSDMKLNLEIPEVYDGFEEWYYTYFVNDRRRGKRGPRKNLKNDGEIKKVWLNQNRK